MLKKLETVLEENEKQLNETGSLASSQITDLQKHMKEEIANCAKNHEIDDLNTRLLQFVQLHHITDFKEEVYPVIDECKNLMKALKEENDSMKECILQFDEALCKKANKSSLLGLENKIY